MNQLIAWPATALRRAGSLARAPGSLRAAVAGSVRVRVAAMLWDASPAVFACVVVFVLADGLLGNLALVALGHAVGRVPAAVRDGLDSASGRALGVSLALGALAYAVSLVRRPAEDLLSAYCSARVAARMQRRLVRAVCQPAGIEHLEDPAVLDRLASASGELSTSRPADAPMALAGALGDRLSGLVACLVLASFRWWLGLLFFAGWTALRPPLRRLVVQRATFARRATPLLRQSWYYLGCAYRPEFAKEMRVFGLAGWALGRYRERWQTAMAPAWAGLRRLQGRVFLLGGLVALMYAAGAAALAGAAYHGSAGLGTVAVMLPMFAATMQVGGISPADVTLEQMLTAFPDLEAVTSGLAAAPAPGAGASRPAGTPPRGTIRFEQVSYRYPAGDRPVLDGLDLELPAGTSLGLVGVNGAGKSTLVSLLGALRQPARGRVTAGGTDLRDLDVTAWQRQVAVVYQDFSRLPLTARENVAFCDLGTGPDAGALEWAAARAGADAVVAALPRGWDTICAAGYQGGADLSGGQWQRIALARALYAVARGAGVLVLDEPTAQLDARSEAAFYDRFLELTTGVTSIVISHRFSTVRRAQRIAVLDGGRVSELGSHGELVAAGGTYAQMFALQAARFAAAGAGGGDGAGGASG